MSGELNLGSLLGSMQPVLHEAELVFCTLPHARSWDPSLEPILVFREQEGVTLILPRTQAEQKGLSFTYPCRMVTLDVHSSLAAVGFLARITTSLAERGVSVNAVSAYFHDYLFVPIERAHRTMEVLRALSREYEEK